MKTLEYQPQAGKPVVVIIGAGFAGLRAALAFAHKPVEVIIIDRQNYHLFQPLLYQVATAGLEPEAIAYPFRAIFRGIPNLHFRLAEVTRIGKAGKFIEAGSVRYPFDFLIVAAGSETNHFGNRRLAASTFDLKKLEDAVKLRNQVLFAFEQAVIERDPEAQRAWTTIVVIGGGPTGVEMAGAYAELKTHVLIKDFPMLDIPKMRIVLVQAADHLLDGFTPELSNEAQRQLATMGVEVKLKCIVEKVENRTVFLSNGERIPSRNVVWCAGVKASPLAQQLTQNFGPNGRVPVTPQLHLADEPNIFVVGDLSYPQTNYPMMAPVAMQQATLAAQNILAHLNGRPLKTFVYRSRGMMATIGRKSAVAIVFGIKMRGILAWWTWLLIHLMQLIGFRNRLVVLINWAYNYFSYERALRLITAKPPAPSASEGP